MNLLFHRIDFRVTCCSLWMHRTAHSYPDLLNLRLQGSRSARGPQLVGWCESLTVASEMIVYGGEPMGCESSSNLALQRSAATTKESRKKINGKDRKVDIYPSSDCCALVKDTKQIRPDWTTLKSVAKLGQQS
jgi:hypothetical protein